MCAVKPWVNCAGFYYFYFHLSGIHEKKQFFPWHRWFIYWFENLLREADCRVTLPFWDWSYWSENPWKIGLHIWRDDELGLGGNGVKEKDYCVQSGPFNASVWAHPAPEKITSVLQSVDNLNGICYTREYGGKHKPCLRRSFSHLPANLAVVLDTISIPCSHFEKFDKSVREDFHNDIHNEIGTKPFKYVNPFMKTRRKCFHKEISYMYILSFINSAYLISPPFSSRNLKQTLSFTPPPPYFHTRKTTFSSATIW